MKYVSSLAAQYCSRVVKEGKALQTNDPDNKEITVSLDIPYNPYEDKTLTETHPEPPILDNRHEPFNDALKYENLLAGRQRNRTISDYPRRQRPWVKVFAISCLALFVIGLLWDFVH